MRIVELTNYGVLDSALFVVWVVAWSSAARRLPLPVVCGTSWLVAASEISQTNALVPLVGSAVGTSILAHRALRRSAIGATSAWSTGIAAVTAAHLAVRGTLGYAGPWFTLGVAALIAAGCTAWFVPASRRRLVISLGTSASLIVLACAGAAWSLGRSLESLRSTRSSVDQAQQAFSSGSLGQASEALARAEMDMRRVEQLLNEPSAIPIRAVPWVGRFVGVARNAVGRMNEMVSTANELLFELERTSGASVHELDVIDFGSIAALTDVMAADIAGFRDDLGDLGDHWLTAEAHAGLRRAADNLATAGTLLEDAADLAQLTPDLLGAAGDRRYFVGFVTPSEARPGMGFLGNYAELVVSGGDLSMVAFGRTSDLALQNRDPATRVLTGLDEYATRYERFGSGGGVTPAASEWWSVVTISPDMPSVAAVIATLYEQAGHQPLDGVIFVDPVALANLMEITGAVTVPSSGLTLDSTTVFDFLVRGQYVTFDGDQIARIDLLEELSFEVLNRLVGSPTLDGAEFARALWRSASGGHGVMWSRRPVEQSVLDRVGLSGNFRRSGSGDGLAITQLNSAANKLDALVRREIDYKAVVNTSTGDLTATATVVLYNDAPSSGLPDYVIGNARGDLPGTNRCFVTLYSPHALSGFSVDGQPAEVTVGTELGWQFAEREIAVPPGGRVVLEYQLVGKVDPDYSLLIASKPTVTPDRFRVNVATVDQRVLVDFNGTMRSTRQRLPDPDLVP